MMIMRKRSRSKEMIVNLKLVKNKRTSKKKNERGEKEVEME